MDRRSALVRPSFIVLALALLLAPAASRASTAPAVTASARLSAAIPVCGGDANAPQIAVQPGDPNHLSAIYSIGNGIAEASALSLDGGLTWSRSPIPGVTKCTGGPDGAVYDNFLAIGSGGRAVSTESWVDAVVTPAVEHDSARVYASRSDDGSTFANAVDPSPSRAAQRAPVSFDPGSNDALVVAYETTHYVNPLTYLFGLGGALEVVRSDDGGKTFGAPVTADSALPGTELVTVGLARSGNAIVLVGASIDDTDAPGFFTGTGPLYEHLFSVTSTDGGRTWSSPAAIASFKFPSGGPPIAEGSGIPDIAAGPDGAVYVVWADIDADTAVVDVTHDAGSTWHEVPSRIPATGEVAFPGVAVSPEGTVGVFFYDKAPGATVVTPTIATSGDGGTTWQRVALASPFDVDAISPGNMDGSKVGPYQDLVGLPNGFGVAVTLARAGATVQSPEPGEVWFVRVAA
jgi:hypothetical protein